MIYAVLFVTAVPVYALAFTVVTYILGIFSDNFRPTEATFLDMYTGFLKISFVFVFLLFIPLHWLPYWIIMTALYRYVFDAGWKQAVVIGLIGGIAGYLMWIYMLQTLHGWGFV